MQEDGLLVVYDVSGADCVMRVDLTQFLRLSGVVQEKRVVIQEW